MILSWSPSQNVDLWKSRIKALIGIRVVCVCGCVALGDGVLLSPAWGGCAVSCVVCLCSERRNGWSSRQKPCKWRRRAQDRETVFRKPAGSKVGACRHKIKQSCVQLEVAIVFFDAVCSLLLALFLLQGRQRAPFIRRPFRR